MATSEIYWGAKGEDPRVLKQGQVPREFPTFADAEREAKRLNGVAEMKGVPWRYWAVVRQSTDTTTKGQ